MNTSRLMPIEKPSGVFMKFAYNMARRRFGKVITPMKVIYARAPGLLTVSAKLESAEKKLSISKSLRLLIKSFVSELNDCQFCADFSRYEALKSDIEKSKLLSLQNYRSSNLFSSQEKAVLTYLEEVTYTKSCSDETFKALRQYFSEREIVEITWLCAKENYYNLLSKPMNIASDQLAPVGVIAQKRSSESHPTLQHA